MKKLLSVVLALAMLSSLLVACGGEKKPEAKKADVVYWTMWESTEPQGMVIKEAVDAYMAATGKVVDL